MALGVFKQETLGQRQGLETLRQETLGQRQFAGKKPTVRSADENLRHWDNWVVAMLSKTTGDLPQGVGQNSAHKDCRDDSNGDLGRAHLKPQHLRLGAPPRWRQVQRVVAKYTSHANTQVTLLLHAQINTHFLCMVSTGFCQKLAHLSQRNMFFWRERFFSQLQFLFCCRHLFALSASRFLWQAWSRGRRRRLNVLRGSVRPDRRLRER